jgi:haloalkane dehalogenase
MGTGRGEAGGARTVTHAGGALHVVDHGGARPAIVAMHGFPDDLRICERLVPFLRPQRVVTFDWLGYGRSSRRDPGSFAATDRQRDLSAVLDELGLDEVVLMAHDASGPEAVEMAMSQPRRIRGLVLFNTYYGRSAPLRFPEMIALMADPAYAPLVSAIVDDEAQRLWLLAHTARQFGLDSGLPPDGIGTRSIFPQFFGNAEQPHALAEIRAWTADLPKALDLQDARISSGVAGALDVPVCLIFGVRDRYLNADVARHLATLFPHAQLHLVEDASHWPQWDQPEVVAGIIRAACPVG